MLNIITRIPSYYLFRTLGWPPRLPFNITLSISYRCNSRCKTCNIYEREVDELTLAEWKNVFKELGRTPIWITISGGEPFLRNDLTELIHALYDYCRPSIINIPTNGLLRKRIPAVVSRIAEYCFKSQIIINVSLDDIKEKHDFIRGVPGSFEKAVETFRDLKQLDFKNLSIGIHTVISKYNVTRIPEIYHYLIGLNPDSYITEIAEEREELGTIGAGITPGYEDYSEAVDFLTGKLSRDHFNSVGKITRAFRIHYYKMVKEIMKVNRQVIQCYAGFVSAQIAPDGDVWNCCIKAEPVGNLREVEYNLKKIWFSEKAKKMRKGIKNAECCCPLANAGYTNMLFDPKSLIHVAWNYIRLS